MRRKQSSPRRVSLEHSSLSDALLTETAARIALVASPVGAPPQRLKETLLARIRQGRTQSMPLAAVSPGTESGWRFISLGNADAGSCVPLAIPGVRIRELTIDLERDVALLYVQMAAGAIFPDHDHTAPERGVVLRGDFQTGDRRLHAGDFYEAAAGTRHERISSPSGCEGLLWVSASGWRRWRAALSAAK